MHISITIVVVVVVLCHANDWQAIVANTSARDPPNPSPSHQYQANHQAGHHNHRRRHHQRPMRHPRAVYSVSSMDDEQQKHNNMDRNRNFPTTTTLTTGNLTGYQNDQQPAVLDQCCACDEAKYEMVFEGLWSRYTHPDEFPENYWLAQFSYIIGASHSNEFRMWSEDAFASEGVKDLAETGSTKKLESELKQASSKTRTIIKARELQYPTLNSKTSAVFRTDRQHHLVSILSKLSPSPDWMVGVSGLELCQTDCSWATQRVVNLYLWDAGTDSGTTFTAPNSPTRPQERIHPFRRSTLLALAGSNQAQTTTTRRPQMGDPSYLYPDANNYRPYNTNESQPDEFQAMGQQQQQQQQQQPSLIFVGQQNSSAANDQSKPFARLTITRQRIYEKSCSGETPYQPATATQQSGNSWHTMNSSQSQLNRYNYQHQAGGESQVLGAWPTEPPRHSYSDCRFTDWSDWSTCSSTCGKGIRTRTRAFLDEQTHLADCSQVKLIEKMVCLSECVGNTTCVTRDWSEWSKCSVNCGQGYRKRTRAPIGPPRKACESVELAQMELCTGPQAPGADGCPYAPADCEVTEWSRWSECSVACGKGTRIRTRRYKRKENVENCTAKLIQKQSCTGRPELCKQSSNKGQQVAQSAQQHQKLDPNLPVIDCKLSAWSPWSTCSALCGQGKRTRSRYIIQMPQNGGKPCDKKLSRSQKCKNLPPCPDGDDEDDDFKF